MFDRSERKRRQLRFHALFGDVFALPPPLPGDWRALDRDMAGLIVARLNERRTGLDADGEVFGLRVLPLMFHPEWILCDMQTSVGDTADLHSFLYGPDGVTVLDGTSSPIHALNAAEEIALTTVAQQEQYLRFFCIFVRGAEGPFEVVTDPKLFSGPKGFESHFAKPAREKPKKAAKKEDAGHWSATILYGDNLFAADFRIATGGMIEMKDDTPRAEQVVRKDPIEFRGPIRRRPRDDDGMSF